MPGPKSCSKRSVALVPVQQLRQRPPSRRLPAHPDDCRQGLLYSNWQPALELPLRVERDKDVLDRAEAISHHQQAARGPAADDEAVWAVTREPVGQGGVHPPARAAVHKPERTTNREVVILKVGHRYHCGAWVKAQGEVGATPQLGRQGLAVQRASRAQVLDEQLLVVVAALQPCRPGAVWGYGAEGGSAM